MTATPTPTGRIVPTPDGRDLVLTRTFRSGIKDVWASITESERTGRWFATWTGEPGPGRTIRYRMTFEGDDAPEAEMTIDACEPPHHLAVSAEDAYGTWRLEARLAEAGGVTTLTFTHHLDEKANPGEVGPGWEYYLDNLVAAHTGTEQPSFDDYFPSMQTHYDSQP